MSGTLILIIAAFILAAGMDVSGGLDKLLKTMLSKARSAFGLITATMASGATMIGLTSHGGVTALIVGGLFQDAYREQGFAPQNLSRSIEDSVTIVEPLMPWTVSALYMATTLGVATVDYAPWALFLHDRAGVLTGDRGGLAEDRHRPAADRTLISRRRGRRRRRGRCLPLPGDSRCAGTAC